MAKNSKPEKTKDKAARTTRRLSLLAERKTRSKTARAEVSEARRASGKSSVPDHVLVPTLTKDPHALKFVLTQPDVNQAFASTPEFEYLGELPDSYGSKRVFLVARDPHWLYAYWDVTWDQYHEASSRASDGKVFLQTYYPDGTRVHQVHVPPHCKSWFMHSGSPGASYYAELGYYDQGGQFQALGRSPVIATPKDYLSPDTSARFVTIPFHFTFRQLLELVVGHMHPGEELVDALCRLQEEGYPFPFDVAANPNLSEEQSKELLHFLGGEFVKRINMGSYEITEIVRQRLSEFLSSGSGSPSSPMGASWSLGSPAFPGFHMHINAELILYGGTVPGSKVRVAGREIELRPDGTFNYHFSFPDGKYHIPVEAESQDGTEMRSALISFMRLSSFTGEVAATGQSPDLRGPLGQF